MAGLNESVWPTRLPREKPLAPNFVYPVLHRPPVHRLRGLSEVAQRAAQLPPILAAAYGARLEELELELSLALTIPERKLARPIAKRLFGTALRHVLHMGESRTLLDVSFDILNNTPPDVPSECEMISGEDFAQLLRDEVASLGLELEVKMESALSAKVAVYGGTILVQGLALAREEALALMRHEIHGHAIAHANAMLQKLYLFRVGTGDAFAHQEGLALWLEISPEQRAVPSNIADPSSMLLPTRRRALAGRVLAVHFLDEGASSVDCALSLHRQFSFSALDAIVLTERAARAGGLGREVGYLRGIFEIHRALCDGMELRFARSGRVGLAVATRYSTWIQHGWARAEGCAAETILAKTISQT